MPTANMPNPRQNSPTPSTIEPARYVMIGGFLGAGKTTAVAQLALYFRNRGLRVGLITNDQGQNLVDTALLGSRGFAVEEIAGGCFCCRFNSLMDAAHKLSTTSRPDVFIAEPVGSCTDLVATVSYPLRRIYGERFVIAPLSVLVDPIRARRVFGLAPGGNFSEKVRYIYRKQLEEADLIIINKRELLDPDALSRLRDTLRSEFPAAQVLDVSARSGDGLLPWFEQLTAAGAGTRPAMAMDYEIYAEGEALLGWLNATIDVQTQVPLHASQLLQPLAAHLHRELAAQNAEIAHLKMTLEPLHSLGGLAVINLVGNDLIPELSQELEEPLHAGQLIVNLRAETDPDQLQAALSRAVSTLATDCAGLSARIEHLEFFRPGKPQPTHRLERP